MSLSHAALCLDSRRNAMLKAMGVELWWLRAPAPVRGSEARTGRPPAQPRSQVAEADMRAPRTAGHGRAVPGPLAGRPAGPAAVAEAAGHSKAQAPVTDSAVIAAQALQYYRLGEARQLAGPQSADAALRWWLVADDCSSLGQGAAAAGQLLNNMLRAMALPQTHQVWLSWVEKNAQQMPAGEPLAMRQTLAADIVLVLGKNASAHVLGSSQPVGSLRGQEHLLGPAPAFVSFSLGYLLRSGSAKRQAWEDLKKAMVASTRLQELKTGAPGQ